MKNFQYFLFRFNTLNTFKRLALKVSVSQVEILQRLLLSLRSFSMLVVFVLTIATVAARADGSIVRPIRAILIIPTNISVDHAKWISEKSKNAGFNTVLFRVSRNIKLESTSWVGVQNEWSIDDLTEWLEFTSSLGLNVIPELKLLTHQEKFLASEFPELLYNSVTYDPSKSEVYDMVFPILQEVIELFQPDAIHIGHDEVAGHNRRSKKRWLESEEATLPAEKFLMHVETLNNFLSTRNVRTWMWGDMLLEPEEFPLMLGRHLHGDFPGYGKELRSKIPKSVLVVDWHNFDTQNVFPSVSTLLEEGFDVLASSWDQRRTFTEFADYASSAGASGMIFTPWGYMLEHRKKELGELIIEKGQILKSKFPSQL